MLLVVTCTATPAVALEPGQMSGGTTTVNVSNQHAFGRSLANLPIEGLRDFAYGNRVFNTTWVTAPSSVEDFDGLGPLFNRASCTACHVRDGRGQPHHDPKAPQNSALVRISQLNPETGRSEPHPVYGLQIQDRAIQGYAPEAQVKVEYLNKDIRYPDGTTKTLLKPQVTIVETQTGAVLGGLEMSFRVAQPVFGLGLLEAVPEAEIMKWTDPDDSDADGISGREQRVKREGGSKGVLGRFGWKAGQPTLLDQSASAFAGDIGITSHVFPRDERTAGQRKDSPGAHDEQAEVRPQDLEKLAFYLRALAVPARRHIHDQQVRRGEMLFKHIGCEKCHRDTLRTGPDAAMPALANQTIRPYTDLLLHDMGPGLADNRPEELADGREWRTPPLWGIGLTKAVNGHTRFLHDGRARNLEEAILWHGGEGLSSQKAFMALTAVDRQAVLRFLGDL